MHHFKLYTYVELRFVLAERIVSIRCKDKSGYVFKENDWYLWWQSYDNSQTHYDKIADIHTLTEGGTYIYR